MKKTLYLISILLIGIFQQSFSQNISTLEKKLQNADGLEEVKLLVKIADAYMDQDLEKCIDYGERALKVVKKTTAPEALVSEIYNTLAAANYYSQNFPKSIKYYEDELELIKKGSSSKKIAQAYYNIAFICSISGKKRKAEKNFESSIAYAKKINHIGILTANYRALAQLQETSGNSSKALEYLKDYLKIKDESFSRTQNILRKEIQEEKQLREETELVVTELEQDTMKKAKQIEVLNLEKEYAEKMRKLEKEKRVADQKMQEAEIAKQKLQNYVLIGLILIALGIGFFIIRSNIKKKKMNELLVNKNFEITQQNEEIETQNNLLQTQKEEIEQNHKHITDSINYASRIQTAMLHGESVLADAFDQYFIIYKPRDVVSGDFYWIKQIRNYVAIVAADCTGHGVPGAFMSMLGVSLLTEHVTSRRLDSPGEILETLRKRVKLYLKQTGSYEEAKDGMDMALCLINTENLKVKYAGANNPLYLMKKNELIEYKATRNPIGIYLKEKEFETHTIQLEKGDSIFMFSDGFVDQFGGEDGGKFKTRRFKQILMDCSSCSMEEQRRKLEDELRLWQGDYEQIDDILVMGIKI